MPRRGREIFQQKNTCDDTDTFPVRKDSLLVCDDKQKIGRVVKR